MFEQLKTAVYDQNVRSPGLGLVILTEGNVSQISNDRKYVGIKPSGVQYESLTAEKIVVVDMQENVVDGELKPSSDTPTHLELYRRFPSIGGIVHTHSPMLRHSLRQGSRYLVMELLTRTRFAKLFQ